MTYDPSKFMWKAKLVSELTADELQQAICQMIDATAKWREQDRSQRKGRP